MPWIGLDEGIAELFADVRLDKDDQFGDGFTISKPAAKAVELTDRWRANNPARHRATVRARHQADPEKHRAWAQKGRENARRRRAADPKLMAAHREKKREWDQARRARLKALKGQA